MAKKNPSALETKKIRIYVGHDGFNVEVTLGFVLFPFKQMW